MILKIESDSDAFEAINQLLAGKDIEIVLSGWPNLDVVIFGGMPTGMYIPEFKSLIDVQENVYYQINTFLRDFGFKSIYNKDIYFSISQGSTDIKGDIWRAFEDAFSKIPGGKNSKLAWASILLLCMSWGPTAIKSLFEWKINSDNIESDHLQMCLKNIESNPAMAKYCDRFEVYRRFSEVSYDKLMRNIRPDVKISLSGLEISSQDRNSYLKRHARTGVHTDGSIEDQFKVVELKKSPKNSDEQVVTLKSLTFGEIFNIVINKSIWGTTLFSQFKAAIDANINIWAKLKLQKINGKLYKVSFIDVFQEGYLDEVKKSRRVSTANRSGLSSKRSHRNRRNFNKTRP